MPKDAHSSAAPPAIAPSASDVSDAPNPAIPIAEAHLAMFAELREQGMQLTRMLVRRVEMDLQSAEKLIAHQDSHERDLPSPRYPAPNNDAAVMFAKFTRALRLTAALEMKTAEKLRALIDGVALDRETRREETARRDEAVADARHEAAEEKVHDLVLKVIQAEARDSDDEGDLYQALRERLEEDEAYERLEDRPLREVVEQLCADLGIAPDWSRWEGDGWKADAFPYRPRLSPFSEPSRRPILARTAPEPPARQASGP